MTGIYARNERLHGAVQSSEKLAVLAMLMCTLQSFGKCSRRETQRIKWSRRSLGNRQLDIDQAEYTITVLSSYSLARSEIMILDLGESQAMYRDFIIPVGTLPDQSSLTS